MLTIRLQRTGKKNQADFRIVLAEKAAPVKKKHLEVLGSYNPRKKDFKVKEERVQYWITQRVELSPTIHNLFVTKGLLAGAKVKAFSIPQKPAEPAAETKPVEAIAASETKSESSASAPATQTPIPATEVAASDESDTSKKSDKTGTQAESENQKTGESEITDAEKSL